MQILDTEITSKKSLDRTFFSLLPSLGSTELTTNSSSFSRSIALTNPEVVLKRRPQFGTVGRRKKGFQLVLYHTQPGIIVFLPKNTQQRNIQRGKSRWSCCCWGCSNKKGLQDEVFVCCSDFSCSIMLKSSLFLRWLLPGSNDGWSHNAKIARCILQFYPLEGVDRHFREMTTYLQHKIQMFRYGMLSNEESHRPPVKIWLKAQAMTG